MSRHFAYYNEIDPFCAQWLRNLMAAGHIAPGYVDERSIEDVSPEDLWEFTQCHWFAGIGVWAYALRQAGWDDSVEIWTGSCPCQPYSAAGKGSGFDDERHLWPALAWHIGQRRPSAILGEQVASSLADPWMDLVQADLEALGYAFGAVPFPSASVGAPHIRDRNYWVGHALGEGLEERVSNRGVPGGKAAPREGQASERAGIYPGRLADTDNHRQPEGRLSVRSRGQGAPQTFKPGCGQDVWASPLHGFWADADWLLCRDGKWRPVEPGTFPLAHGAASRVGRLRAYGNALNAQAAITFIKAVM